MDSDAGPRPDPELLAELQAGLLDDATAADLRRRVRTDPEAARTLAALDAVRSELAHLGADADSAPAVPLAVTARMTAALRAAPPPPGHALHRPRLTRNHRIALVVGLVAAALAVVIGALMLHSDPPRRYPPGPTASLITVAAPPSAVFPVPDTELRAALTAPPQLGPLSEPHRLGSCLTGLGHAPTETVLGARPVELATGPALLLLLPGSRPDQVSALVVVPTCAAAHTGLVAETVLERP